ncbi:hypothetical protein BH10ACI1_BH10ACI1_11920 [soil metagenome]
MSKKLITLLLLFLIVFFHPIFNSKANAQTNNPRYFNERFVVQALVTISSAEATYSATSGNGNYGSLNDLLQATFIDSILASGDKYGYTFALSIANSAPAKFNVTATPHRYQKTGRRSFYIDESGEMRGADKNGAVADVSDPTIDSCTMSGFSNENCTIRDMRTFSGAQMTYQATVGDGNFGTLSQLYAAGLIHPGMASGTTHGYNFVCLKIDRTPDSPASFKISAIPVNYGVTGFRSFYIDINGILRGADKNGEPADENDPPIDN